MEALQDYELLELMLGTALPRREPKPLAKDLHNEIEDLRALLHAPDNRLSDLGHG